MANALVFLACFAVYAWTASPAMGWLDAPEFVAASASLGVPHSPGHPLPALVGKLCALIPIGDVATRVNLASALAAAAAAVAVMHAARLALARAAPSLAPRARAAAAAAAALVFAFSGAVHVSAIRAEVYALTAVLALAALAALLAWDRPPGADDADRKAHDDGDRNALDDAAAPVSASRTGWLYAAALLLGLALATHHFIAALVALPALAFVVTRARTAPAAHRDQAAQRAGRPRAATLGLAVAFGALGLAALAYLPVRSATHPEVNWGAPHTAERFAWTVSARAFARATAGDAVTTRGQDAAQVAAAIADHATPALAVLALLGLYLGVRRRGARAQTLLLTGVAALAAAGRVLVGFEPGVPDHVGYLVPAIAAVILLGACGAAQLAGAVADLVADRARVRQPDTLRAPATRVRQPGTPPHDRADVRQPNTPRPDRADVRQPDTPRAATTLAAAVAVAVALAALIPLQLARHVAPGSLAHADASDATARWELEALPPRTLLLPAYFQTSFRLWALRTVEHARPDIDVLDRSFLTYPGAADEARRRYPALDSLLGTPGTPDSPLRAGAPSPVAALRDIARARPVAVQLHINVDAALEPHLWPAGPFALLLADPPTPAQRALLDAHDENARRALVRSTTDALGADREGVRQALLWHDFVRLRQFCHTGRLQAARRALDHVVRAAPDDPTIAALVAECGLAPPAPSMTAPVTP